MYQGEDKATEHMGGPAPHSLQGQVVLPSVVIFQILPQSFERLGLEQSYHWTNKKAYERRIVQHFVCNSRVNLTERLSTRLDVEDHNFKETLSITIT